MKKTANAVSFESQSNKRVSFVLTTRNRANFLEQALGRTKRLMGKNDELIVVDGASIDNTLDVIKSYRGVITKYISEPDLNPPHAANKGILIASGKYIKLVTDDDIIYKGALQKAVKIMDRNSEIDILDCGGIRFYKPTGRMETIYKQPGINYGRKVSDVFNYGASGMGYVIRRSSFAKTGLFPVELIGDITYLINAIQSGAKVKFCRIKLFRQTIHKTNVSQRPEMMDEIYRVVKKYAPREYYYRYVFNQYIFKHPNLKPLVKPLVLLFKISKDLTQGSDHKARNKKIVWDGGFS